MNISGAFISEKFMMNLIGLRFETMFTENFFCICQNKWSLKYNCPIPNVSLLFPASPWKSFNKQKKEPPFKKRKVEPPQGTFMEFHLLGKCILFLCNLCAEGWKT